MTYETADVSLFVPTLHGGGAERVMVDLAATFARWGHTADLVTLDGARDLAELDGVDADVRHVRLDARRMAGAGLPLLHYLHQRRPRALLSTLEHSNVVALNVGRLAPHVRVVAREANDSRQALPTSPSGRAMRWAMRSSYLHAHRVVAVSAAVGKSLELDLGVPPSRVVVIDNPAVTPRLWAGAAEALEDPWFGPGEPPVILGVGRLAKQKRFDLLLEAFARLRQRDPARLLILGEGPERTALEAQAQQLGVADDVRLNGFTDNPFAYMRHAAVFALTSDFEGMPNALIQARALGVPVVARTAAEGVCNVLDGTDAARVASADPDELAAALQQQMGNPHQRPDPAWIDRFRLESAARRYARTLGMDA